MKSVPPLPGEEALYHWIGSVLDAAATAPAIKQALTESAVAAERELIPTFFEWRYNGRPAGNGWNSPVNNAKWGTDYLNRTGTARSNMYDNRPEETKYNLPGRRQPGPTTRWSQPLYGHLPERSAPAGQRFLVGDLV